MDGRGRGQIDTKGCILVRPRQAVIRAALLRNERLPSVAIWITFPQKEISVRLGSTAYGLPGNGLGGDRLMLRALSE
jgi:hypothetical protein